MDLFALVASITMGTVVCLVIALFLRKKRLLPTFRLLVWFTAGAGVSTVFVWILSLLSGITTLTKFVALAVVAVFVWGLLHFFHDLLPKNAVEPGTDFWALSLPSLAVLAGGGFFPALITSASAGLNHAASAAFGGMF